MAELLKSANIVDNYSELTEVEKVAVLLKELQEDPRTLSSTNVPKSEILEKELAISRTARLLKDYIGEDVIKQQIISHTESVSDMFELAILLKEVGLINAKRARVQIVPLFETIEDLENSNDISENNTLVMISLNVGLRIAITTKKSCWVTQTLTKMVVTCLQVERFQRSSKRID